MLVLWRNKHRFTQPQPPLGCENLTDGGEREQRDVGQKHLPGEQFKKIEHWDFLPIQQITELLGLRNGCIPKGQSSVE